MLQDITDSVEGPAERRSQMVFYGIRHFMWFKHPCLNWCEDCTTSTQGQQKPITTVLSCCITDGAVTTLTDARRD